MKIKHPPLKKTKYTYDEIPKTLCPIPFSTLILNPDGKVGCCRERTNHDTVGDMTENTWQEIWNGEEIREWRREFISGDIKRCANHIKNRLCNLSGYNRLLLPTTEFTEYQEKPPTRLSPDFNGECNLECIMCKVWELPNGLYDKLGFWTKAEEEWFSHIKFMDPLAGEPFIQKDFYRLIRIMHEKSPDAQWRFTTNGHWKFTQYIKDHLNMVKNIYSIQTSIDGATPETYSRVRKNGNLAVALKNLEDQIKYKEQREAEGLSSYKMLTMMTVIRENWTEIPAMCRLMESVGTNYHFIKCNGPDDQMIITLSEKERLTILEYLFNNLEDRDLIHVYRVLIPLIDSLSESLEIKKIYKKIFFAHTGYFI